MWPAQGPLLGYNHSAHTSYGNVEACVRDSWYSLNKMTVCVAESWCTLLASTFFFSLLWSKSQVLEKCLSVVNKVMKLPCVNLIWFCRLALPNSISLRMSGCMLVLKDKCNWQEGAFERWSYLGTLSPTRLLLEGRIPLCLWAGYLPVSNLLSLSFHFHFVR